MKKLLLLLVVILGHLRLIALSTSIIIPCHPKHACHLYNLLSLYEQQTVLPNEIVIAMSQAHLVSPYIIKKLRKSKWIFPVKVLTTKQQFFAGQNRNWGCVEAKGDILITQDADDLTHPQRVEIVKYFFATYNLDHLLFGCSNTEYKKYYDVRQIPYHICDSYDAIWKLDFCITQGNIAITRRVFSKLRWNALDRQEDSEYNRNAYLLFKKCMVIQADLHVYRPHLSSLSKRGFFMNQRELLPLIPLVFKEIS